MTNIFLDTEEYTYNKRSKTYWPKFIMNSIENWKETLKRCVSYFIVSACWWSFSLFLCCVCLFSAFYSDALLWIGSHNVFLSFFMNGKVSKSVMDIQGNGKMKNRKKTPAKSRKAIAVGHKKKLI